MKASDGASKNITPKREKTRSTEPGAKGSVAASARSTAACASSRAAIRCPATASMGPEMSTPVTLPSGPTASASASTVSPQPQPMSSTRSPGRGAAAATAAALIGAKSPSSRSCRRAHLSPFSPFQ